MEPFDFHGKTAQETFDYVVRALAEQGGPAWGPINDRDEVGGCLYRAPDGRKCAFGQVLPDELYTPSMENHYIPVVIRKIGADGTDKALSTQFAQWVCEHLDMLRELQAAHDRAAKTTRESKPKLWTDPWKETGVATRLHEVAQKFGLGTKTLLEVFPQ